MFVTGPMTCVFLESCRQLDILAMTSEVRALICSQFWPGRTKAMHTDVA